MINVGDVADLRARPEGLDGPAVMVTDPPWPNAPEGMFPGLRGRAPEDLVRHAIDVLDPDGVVLVLGAQSDPRWLARAVPDRLPFVRSARLRFAVPSYRGIVLNDALSAFVFGAVRPTPPRRVLPGEVTSSESGARRSETSHPCPMRITHALWLLEHFARPDQVVLDPFAGSGVIPAAAERLGRRWWGLEVSPTWAAEADERIRAERTGASVGLMRSGQEALFGRKGASS